MNLIMILYVCGPVCPSVCLPACLSIIHVSFSLSLLPLALSSSSPPPPPPLFHFSPFSPLSLCSLTFSPFALSLSLLSLSSSSTPPPPHTHTHLFNLSILVPLLCSESHMTICDILACCSSAAFSKALARFMFLAMCDSLWSFFHFIRRFWNQILICRSVRFNACAISILRRRVRYLL